MPDFQIVSPFQPDGDQPAAIEKLVAGFRDGHQFQTLLGVTGSGKTFTMAHAIESLRRPALIISHNKTLAAQLYEEFRELFPENAVEYFVSYYDYYQPEAYIPQRDIYIEKDASRNDELDRLRLAATSSLTSRQDVIIIASVSCIFGLGSPEEYKRMVVAVRKDLPVDRDTLLERLVEIQYERCGVEFKRGTFRVLGDTVEIFPAYEQFAYRVQLFGDQVEQIDLINPLTNEPLSEADSIFIYPAKHYVMPEDRISSAVASIGVELESRLSELRTHGKLLEAQRLAARTKYDMEMIQEVGYCSGIENYARHLANLPPGSRPYTLIDYFPKDFLLMIDESHATIPQLNAMFNGDRQRKLTLVEHGFRLPSALDNRPLRFEEFRENWHQVLFVSATPGPFELEVCRGEVVEQIIRPTGLLDPQIEVHSARDQVSDLLVRIKQRVAAKQRVLVTTLTKRLAEDLAEYISGEGIRCEYLHSEINTLERVEILRNLRRGQFDVLVGVNLLREGLDLPEVSMVAILDADKEGFLRSETSLIQMIGRTARNIDAIVVLYADKITPSMRRAIDETERRRQKQEQFNNDHGITPQTIVKEIRGGLERQLKAQRIAREAIAAEEEDFDRGELVQQLEREMLEAAENLEFEKAAELRDRLAEVKQMPELDGSKKAKAGVMPQSKRSRSREKRKRAMDR